MHSTILPFKNLTVSEKPNRTIKYETVVSYVNEDGTEEVIKTHTTIETPEQFQIVNQVMPIHAVRKDLLCLKWIRDWSGIAVAGGHVLNAVIGDEEASLNGDIDIFLLGKKKSIGEVKILLRRIYRDLKDCYGSDPFIDFRKNVVVKDGKMDPFCTDGPVTSRTCTFKVKGGRQGTDGKYYKLKVQVVLCTQFETISDLLTSFDLNNCQFAYKDGQFYATVGAEQYLKDKTVKYYNPDNNSYRKMRLQKYEARKYNKILKCTECPPGQALHNLLDYDSTYRNNAVTLFDNYAEAVKFMKEERIVYM
jgi:hypothetical protein